MQLENLNCGMNMNADIRQLFPHSKEDLPLMDNLMTDIIYQQDLHTSLPFLLVCYAHQKERFILDRLCLSRRKGRLYLTCKLYYPSGSKTTIPLNRDAYAS